MLKHEEFLVNAVTDGKSSAGAWYDSYCELMDERMVYGSLIYDSGGNKSTANYTQLNLFRHNPRLILTNYMRYWMRNIASSNSFAAIRYNDLCYLSPASEIWGGVRPYALIY